MSLNALPSPDELSRTLGPGTGPKSRRKPWLVGGGLAALGGAVLLSLALGPKKAKVEYLTAPTTQEDLKVTVRATGSLQAITSVEVGAEVTGRVLKVLVDVNDEVRKGQVLAILDTEQLSSALDQARAQLFSAEATIRQAEATAQEAERNLGRYLRLRKEGILAQADLDGSQGTRDRAEAALKSARESWRVAKAALDAAASKLDKATIRAPIDGVVLSRLVEPGQTVTAGFQTPVLFKLAQDLRQMRLNVDIDEADVSRIRAGQGASFTVESYPGRDFPSTVDSLQMDPKVSQNVVTYRAVLKVDNGARHLLPGMTCTATIQAETRPRALVVPNAALRFVPGSGGSGLPGFAKSGINPNDGKRRVWVLKEGGLEPIEVKAGASDGRFTELLSGNVPEGTRVVTDMKERS